MFAAFLHIDSVGGGPPGGMLSLSIRVYLNRSRLDRELAEGANPTTDPARALRAQQLVSARSRRVLANGLRRLLAHARQPPVAPWAVSVALNRREVLDAADLLEALADRLESVPNACPRAVALVSFLISDPMSPANGVLRDPVDLSAERHATTAQLAGAALDAIATRPLR